MKKKVAVVFTILLTTLMLVSAVLAGIFLIHGDGLMVIDCSCVNVPIERAPVPFDDLICVPVIKTLGQLGYEISPQESGRYLVKKGGKTFVLDYDSFSLTEQGNAAGSNYLVDLGTTNVFGRKKEGDLFLSTNVFRKTLNLMESGYDLIDISYFKIVILLYQAKS